MATIAAADAGEAPIVPSAVPSARKSWSLAGQRWLTPVLVLVLWELGARLGFIPPRVLAAPSTVLATFWELTASGVLPHNLAVSLMRAGAGLSIGLAVGIVLALVAGLSRVGENSIDPLMQIKRTIPSLALTPLFIIWFGIGEQPKILLIALGTLFPIYLNLFNGIRSIDVRLVEAAKTLGLSRLEIITNVILPGALPSLLVGLRYALGVSVLVLVVAEQINATAGLGYLINNARDFMQTDVIVVCIMIYAVLGLSADALVRSVEGRLLSWRPSILGQ